MEIDKKEYLHEHKIHRILMHSYLVYFLLFLIGIFLDLIFSLEILSGSVMIPLGVLLLVLATFLIFWAQKTSQNLLAENITKEIFYRGPYCYTSNPIHWGLFFLILGFGILVNAVFVVLLTLFSFLITHFLFLDKHEKIMEERYGSHYTEYKKMVKF